MFDMIWARWFPPEASNYAGGVRPCSEPAGLGEINDDELNRIDEAIKSSALGGREYVKFAYLCEMLPEPIKKYRKMIHEFIPEVIEQGYGKEKESLHVGGFIGALLGFKTGLVDDLPRNLCRDALELLFDPLGTVCDIVDSVMPNNPDNCVAQIMRAWQAGDNFSRGRIVGNITGQVAIIVASKKFSAKVASGRALEAASAASEVGSATGVAEAASEAAAVAKEAQSAARVAKSAEVASKAASVAKEAETVAKNTAKAAKSAETVAKSTKAAGGAGAAAKEAKGAVEVAKGAETVSGKTSVAAKEVEVVSETGAVAKAETAVEGANRSGIDCSNQFYKRGGGSNLDDFMTPHAQKHAYNPDVKSTRNKTQFGENMDVAKLREDTMLYPDKVVYDSEHNVIKYIKEYDFNISTADTPTGSHRVFIALESKAGKTNRNSQFPYYRGDK